MHYIKMTVWLENSKLERIQVTFYFKIDEQIWHLNGISNSLENPFLEISMFHKKYNDGYSIKSRSSKDMDRALQIQHDLSWISRTA